MSVTERCTALLVTAIIVGVTFTDTVEGQALCGDYNPVASDVEQYITSPGYPKLYANDLDCQWTISANSTSGVVVLNVLDLELEGGAPQCPSDYLTIHDGATLARRLCGQVPEFQIISTGGSFTLTFHSDSSVNFRGFRIGYTSQDKSALCGDYNPVASDVEQYITSPGYPKLYANDLDCQWTISANSTSGVVVLNVLDLELEGGAPQCPSDYLTIHDGATLARRLCGQLPEFQIISTGGSVTLTFHSDSSVNFRGFRIGYTSQDKSVSDLCSNVALSATETVEYINSPGYPSNYPSLLDCQWTITVDSPTSVVVLKLLDFHLENSTSCSKDNVQIYDGPGTNSTRIQFLCGQVSSAQFTSSGRHMTVTFHTDETDTNRGFNLEYTSQEKSALCTNVPLLATDKPGYITSPNYPNNYPSNMDCQWIISTDSSSRVVVLKLFDFALEGTSPACNYDFVAIYDGYSTSSPRIHLLCGLISSAPFISSGPYMTVAFRSDVSNTNRGFILEYTSKEKTDLCENVTLHATETTSYITSPGYPNNYPSNLNCHWTISAGSPSRVVVMKLLDFALEGTVPSCIYDSLSIYDGPSTNSVRIHFLCGQVSSTQFISGGAYLTVVFHSDGSNSFRGFRFEYNSHETGVCSNTNVSANATGQFITSPDYPNDYPSNIACQWTISADLPSSVVVLKLLDFSLEAEASCTHDSVTIYDGSSTNSSTIQVLCGDVSSTQFISSGPFITVVFHSDGGNNFKGFKLEYTSQEMSALCANVTLTATGASNYFTSPGYPKDYPSNMGCQWNILADTTSRVVVLKVLDFELEGSTANCTFDYVAIYDGPSTSSPTAEVLCGQVLSKQVISTGPYLTVMFFSDGSSNYRGFKFEYNTQESAQCADVQLTANEAAQNITSPGYPSNYPSNIGCQWSITAGASAGVVVLSVMDFELEGTPPECAFDYVEIYDGPSASSPRIQLLCGNLESATQFTSTGPHLTVVFHSDGAINFKGFSLGYTSQ